MRPKMSDLNDLYLGVIEANLRCAGLESSSALKEERLASEQALAEACARCSVGSSNRSPARMVAFATAC